METAPLKSFATWARTTLIREVTARIAVVLASASPDRVEQPKAVAALEQAVNAAGGGDKGRAAVADRVAYTWFNRIIALRFMDANGYNGTGVVSPQAGVDVGQPEILAEAKRGNIDGEVVGQRIGESVTGLLNGTRRSEDPQGEAYALLLTEYCRHWHKVMPFMFEREGDYTELLIPANLLADDSVLNRAVKVLTDDVCQDVEVIGWLYQFYISERKAEVFAGYKKGKKAGPEEIPPATQLFTPHWIVRYLVENSLGRLWMLNHPTSRLVDQMEYYIEPLTEETGFLKINSPEELTVMDPACGSGHMLTYAFDLLYSIYEEEGYAPSDIPELILTHNLCGTEIDPRAAALAAFALTMKARARQRTFFNKRVELIICVVQPVAFTPQQLDLLVTESGDRAAEESFWNQFDHANTLGSLIRPDTELTSSLALHLNENVRDDGDLLAQDMIDRAHRVVTQADLLSRDYAVVVANPPYMGSGNMNSQLAEFAKTQYPTSKADLFAMFIERCRRLAYANGYVAMITMQSWMFLSTFSTLRQELLLQDGIVSMAHLGTGAFESVSGEVVATTAFVFQAQGKRVARGDYVRLTDVAGSAKRARLSEACKDVECRYRFRVAPEFLKPIPGMPIAYWVGEPTIESYRSRDDLVGKLAHSEGKNVTTNNAKFARFHWEVDRSAVGAFDKKWLPCAFGGEPRRWAGNTVHVIDWSPTARDYYRKAPAGRIIREEFWRLTGVTWSKIGTGPAGFRVLRRNEMYQEVAVLQTSWDDTLYLAALLNSSVARHYLAFLSPTMNFQLEDIKSIPVVGRTHIEDALREVAERAVELANNDWNESEQSFDYATHALLTLRGQSFRPIAQLMAELKIVWQARVDEMRTLEAKLDAILIDGYGLAGEVSAGGQWSAPTLFSNPAYAYPGLDGDAASSRLERDCVAGLISFAVGCMFGRYSLDEPGLILADQGATTQDYLAKISNPIFTPDADNAIPIVDGDWFEDDIVARFRQFLRAAFGDEYFEENLRFVTESLGVKDLRDYFVKSFYKDHVQRFKRRPIYWLFASPKGSFNALIYMHRYTPSTVSTVLNEYLREYKAKLESSLHHHERLAAGGGTARQQAAAQKEADRLRKELVELEEYEHDVLYPLASEQIEIDLDDGVKANYPKFGAALKKIPGLEASE